MARLVKEKFTGTVDVIYAPILWFFGKRNAIIENSELGTVSNEKSGNLIFSNDNSQIMYITTYVRT